MSSFLQHQAQHLAAAMPPLLVETLRVAQTVRMGVHGRRRVGGGYSFWQYRSYEGHDPATLIDWKQSARGDNLYVRQREWEAVQTVYLWADRSGSMHYQSKKDFPLKTERAHVLMMALAHLLLRGGETAVWLTQPTIAARSLPSFNTMAARLLPITKTDDNLPPFMPLARHAHIVLCSDFLGDINLWRERLRAYTSLNMRGILLHVTDPEEENPSFHGRVRVSGLENETPLLLSEAEAVRPIYHERFEAHKARLQDLAKSVGWSYMHHVTSFPSTAILMNLINTLTAPQWSK